MNIDPKLLQKFHSKAPKVLSPEELMTEFFKAYEGGNKPLRELKLFLRDRKVSGERYVKCLNYLAEQLGLDPIEWGD